MKRLGALGIAMLAGMPSPFAADAASPREAPPAVIYRVPPRSPEASLFYASYACWRGCAQQCGWQYQACLGASPQGICMAQNDGCDRACQSQCRSYGGPLLPLN